MIVGEPIPILYVQMDGTGVPVVKKETEGRKGKTDGQPAHTREVKLGCVFTQTRHGTKKATPFAIPIRLPTPEPSRPPKSSASASIWKPGTAAGAARRRKSLSAMEPNGSGIWPTSTSPARFRSSISIMPVSTFGNWRAGCTPTIRSNQKVWMKVHQKRLLDKGKIEKLVLSLRSIESTQPRTSGEDSHRRRLL